MSPAASIVSGWVNNTGATMPTISMFYGIVIYTLFF